MKESDSELVIGLLFLLIGLQIDWWLRYLFFGLAIPSLLVSCILSFTEKRKQRADDHPHNQTDK